MSRARQSWPHLLAAFVAMGGWALFANRGHGTGEALRAGLVQGTLSACLTYGMKRLIEALAARLSGRAAVLLPPLACGALSVTLLTTIHGIAGTPEVLATIAVPVTVATGWAAVYSFTLSREPTA